MNKKDVSIATITLARNEDEEALLRTSLLHLAKLQLPVFITDGGSGPDFLAYLNRFPQFKVSEVKGRGVYAQARNSLTAAHRLGSPFIFYTEPDKSDFFQQGLPQLLNTAEVNEETGIITASRSAESFATFPAFQQMTETTINTCCKEVMGEAVDYTYGPFLMNSKILPFLDGLQDHIGWGWRPAAFNIAKRLGYKVEAHIGQFFCPLSQREDHPGERLYRMRQLSQNIEGIILSTTMALPR